eukprot:CAMPEP_0118943012 /NCGR_PEP_ID=MMETSP1169-20130426/37334_1 /TAXON_ID=36882 /ORGANISM="Pyramimonas obovata, Strain CCMP722" /LENGTH=42 /DNA_ID= /DNA_START= /DNA_END= /DNA_ORIENTATION=
MSTPTLTYERRQLLDLPDSSLEAVQPSGQDGTPIGYQQCPKR